MFEFRGHKEARKFCQANPINDIQTGEGREGREEREREREREGEREIVYSR